jgi:hypothetical protein
MKRTILTILALFLLSGWAMAEPARISCTKVYAGTIAASGSAETAALELQRNEGFFSVQAIGTFTGTLQIQYALSNDGGTTWSPAVEIVASATSGTIYPYPAAGVNIFAKHQKLIFNETGTSDQVIITGVHRCVQ